MNEFKAKGAFNATEYLRKNCPEYPPISTAPETPATSAAWGAMTRKQRDEAESRWLAIETDKTYCALSGSSADDREIWLMRNPAVYRHFETVANGKSVKYPARWRYEGASLPVATNEKKKNEEIRF